MAWNSLHFGSLKKRIIFTTLGIFLASLWSLSFYACQMLRKDMEHLLGEQQFSTVSMVAGQINRELERRIAALESVAALAGGPMQAGPSATQTFLEQRPDLRALFTGGIFTVRSDGERTAYDPYAAYRFGINLIDRDYIAGPIFEGKATIGRPIIGRTEQAPVIVMAVPVRDNQGTVIGALAGSTILSVSTFMDPITENRYGKTGGYLLSAPKYNLYVTATDKSLIMQPLPAQGVDPMQDRYKLGYEGYGVSVSFRGVEQLTAAKSIPVADWMASIALPTEEAFAPIRKMQERMLSATLFLTLLAGWMSWWMIRRSNALLRLAIDHLVASEKLASLGQLVAGVAHELNTPLGNMLTVSTTLDTRIKQFAGQVNSGTLQRSSLDRFLADCSSAAGILTRGAEHAAELIGNFKQIAVDQSSLRCRSFDFAAVVRETLSTLHNRLKKTAISVGVDIPDGIILDNYPGPIEQILTNLIINSQVHAFDEGQKGDIRIGAQARDGHLHMSYEDDGRGMSEEVAKRVFDPFFTTKFGQGGSGLGLSIVHSLVTGVLHGTLRMTTHPGAGTRFDLSFPLDAPPGKPVEDR